MNQRRIFIKELAALTASSLLVSCQKGQDGATPLRRIKLGEMSRFGAPETVLFVERLLIRRDHIGLSAMSLVCTHQSCMVHADRNSSGSFLCPCHGSRFSSSGKVETGPANRDLPWIELEVDPQKNLWALFGKQVSPDWRLPYDESA